ncbi:MAG: BspA family leucine-rich repeat surface protein [bacterium]|nr:BspA family leucine-rich repeat surface protein [bacterium]
MKNTIRGIFPNCWLLCSVLTLTVITASFSMDIEYQTPSDAPSGLTATAISNSVIQLTWTDNSDEESGFKIERSLSQDSGFESFAILPPNSTYLVDHGLLADTTYFYRVKAISDLNDSEYSEIASATTGSNELELPYYFENTDVGSPNIAGTATFTDGFFDLVGNGYMDENRNSFHFVYQTLKGDGEILGQLTKMLQARWDHQGLMIRESLEPEASYAMAELYRHERAPLFRARNNGEYLEALDTTINFDTPVWVKLNREGDLFIASISKDEDNWEEFHRESISMSEDVFIGLVSHADRTDKTSPSTWRDVRVSQSYIAAPNDLIASSSRSDEIILTWQDNADNETGFRIERALKGEDIWEDLVEVGANTTSFIDDGLTPGATYFYRISAIDGNQSSFPSNEIAAEVLLIPNTILFMQRLAGDEDRTSFDNIISVTKTADTINNVLRHPGMNGKEVEVELENTISSMDGAISLKIRPRTSQQTIKFFNSEFVTISQDGGQLSISANGVQNMYDVVMDSVTCNHLVLNFKDGIMSPYINGTFFDGVAVGNFDFTSFALEPYNGDIWDVLIVDAAMSTTSIESQSQRCISTVVQSDPPFANFPYPMCGVYQCLWAKTESDLLIERKRARLMVQEITFDRNTFDIGMYVQPDLDAWLKRERNSSAPGDFEYFSLNSLFTKNQSNTSYLLHENFHGFQVPLLKGGKWLAEASADWAAWNFYNEPLKGYAISAFTLNPHMAMQEQFPANSEFYHRVVRFYHSSVMLAYITTYLTDQSIIGDLYNTQGVEQNAFLTLIGLLEDQGIDFDQAFAEFAARTAAWDYLDPQMSQDFRANEKRGINAGLPDYRFVDILDETGTYGVFQPVPEEFLPGSYGWNAYRIDSTASGSYTIKLKGSDQNPDYLDFIGKVTKGKPGAYEYVDLIVSKEVTLGTGEAVVEVNTDAGEELFLVVVAASRQNQSNRDVPYIYEYAIESSAHILPNDHIRTFTLDEETRRAIIDHEELTISAQVVRGTDITKLTPVITLSDGATSSPSSEEEIDFTIPVTYSVTGEGGSEAKEWTVSVSAEASRTDTDFLTFELQDLVRFAAINEEEHTVIANMESTINLSSVVPIFTLSEGATSEPASGEEIDLTSPVTYTVTAEDGITSQEWTVSAADFRPFITSWETTTPNTEIAIPVNDDDNDFIYTWKDANGDVVLNNAFNTSEGGTFSVTLPTIGTYTLEIVGEYPHFTGYPKELLKDVLQWGDIHWGSMNSSFRSWKGESFSATDLPNLRKVSSMFRMFERAEFFNGDISQWDVSNVSTMTGMFQQAKAFNGDISGWDVRNLEDASEMFRETRAFNADISKWDTRNLRNMNRMFFSASAFDHSLGDWNISSVTVMTDALKGGFSTLNYDRTLIGWAAQNVREEVNLGAGASFCVGEEAREQLTGEFGWTINDGGLDCPEGGGTDIIRFELDEEISPAVINDVNHSINISVPGGTNIIAMEPSVIISSGATSTPAIDEIVDFSQPVVYSVIAEDGNTQQDWTITVTEALNTGTDFISFIFADASDPVFINLDNHAIVTTVDERMDLTNLTPSFDLSSGATSNLPSGEVRDFSQSLETPVVYTITAEDGVTKQNWKVIVAPRESSDILSTENWINLQLYPNPTSRYLFVEGPGKLQAYVVDLDGKLLTSIEFGDHLTFDLDNLSDGIYLLVARFQNQVITQRVVIQSEN